MSDKKKKENFWEFSGISDAKQRITQRLHRLKSGKQDPITVLGGTVVDVTSPLFTLLAKGTDAILPGNPIQKTLEKVGQTMNLGNWINAAVNGKNPWSQSNRGFHDLLSEEKAEWADDAWNTLLLGLGGAKGKNYIPKTKKPQTSTVSVQSRQPVQSRQLVPVQNKSIVIQNKSSIPNNKTVSTPKALSGPKEPLLLTFKQPEKIATIYFDTRTHLPEYRWAEKGQDGKLVRGSFMTPEEIGKANKEGTLMEMNRYNRIKGPWKGIGKGGIYILARKIQNSNGGWYNPHRELGKKLNEKTKGKYSFDDNTYYIEGFDPFGKKRWYKEQYYLDYKNNNIPLNFDFGDISEFSKLLKVPEENIKIEYNAYGPSKLSYKDIDGKIKKISPKDIPGYIPSYDPISGKYVEYVSKYPSKIINKILSESPKVTEAMEQARKVPRFDFSMPKTLGERANYLLEYMLGPDWQKKGTFQDWDTAFEAAKNSEKIRLGDIPHREFVAFNPIMQNQFTSPNWMWEALSRTKAGESRFGTDPKVTVGYTQGSAKRLELQGNNPYTRYDGFFGADSKTIDDAFYTNGIRGELVKTTGKESPSVKIFDGIIELKERKRNLEKQQIYDPELDNVLKYLLQQYNQSIRNNPKLMLGQQVIFPKTTKTLILDANGAFWDQLNSKGKEVKLLSKITNPQDAKVAEIVRKQYSTDDMITALQNYATKSGEGTSFNNIYLANVSDGSLGTAGAGTIVGEIPVHTPPLSNYNYMTQILFPGTKLGQSQKVMGGDFISLYPGKYLDANGNPYYHLPLTPEYGYQAKVVGHLDDSGQLNHNGFYKKGGKVSTLLSKYKQGGVLPKKKVDWEEYQKQNRKWKN